jgi:hypothetical protein
MNAVNETRSMAKAVDIFRFIKSPPSKCTQLKTLQHIDQATLIDLIANS